MAKTESIRNNIPEYSVSDLAFSLKRTLEENYGHVRVRGELSRVKIHTSGHLYTDLKDEGAVINAVCWKGTVSKLSIRPEEGLEVVCTGKISTYPARSNYQLVIESMELAGEGALLKMLEERKKKLATEGLFDADRKKEIPFLPGTIGVITSPTGAVIRDILHRLEDRFPRHVIVWPVLVQGPGAAEQIARAIDGFNKLTPRPDLLIVARGGGSLEDLMPFNEEIVVRAAANSQIPLISAVGHETDTTLIDYAADLRAPTPTGAAEMAVPVRANLIAQILDDEQRLVSSMARMISELRHRLRAAKIANPSALFDLRAQSLDHAGDRLTRVFGHYIFAQQNRLTASAAKLRQPRDVLDAAQKSLERWSENLAALAPKFITDLQKKLQHAEKLLQAYSFENVLERGFAIVRDAKGAVITGAAQTRAGQNIEIFFARKQSVAAVVAEKKAKK